MDQANVEQFVQSGGTAFWSMWSKFGTPIEDAQTLPDEAAANEDVKLYKADSIAELAEVVGLDTWPIGSRVRALGKVLANRPPSAWGPAVRRRGLRRATCAFAVRKVSNRPAGVVPSTHSAGE